MSIAGTNWISTKYNFLKNDAAKKGIFRSFLENLFEFSNKKKFSQMGVAHPDFCKNLDETNATSLFKDANENQPSSFYSLNKAFKQLKLKPAEISMVDIGCGSGRVLSFGMLSGFKEVYGVDLDRSGLEKAQQNCETMLRNGATTIFTLMYADASTYAIPKDVNVIYMFNPFGEKTMRKIVENIINYSAGVIKNVYIIYSNPTCKHLFDNNNKFRKVLETYFKNKKPDITIYQLTPELI